MKLPFDLGVKLIFRLLLPGFLLMLGVRPILLTLADASGASAYNDVVCVVAALILGWVVTLLDMPIYMLFEGRRFWPHALWELGVRRETARLQRWRERERSHYNRSLIDPNPIHRRRYEEASVELRRFPLDEATGEYTAAFPTRFGNAVTAFEQYPYTRYGADAIFFFPRVWSTLDKDAREELDTQQALADSALYSSVAVCVTGLLWISYLAVPWVYPGLRYTATPRVALLIGAAGLLSSAALYRAAIHVNDQFGSAFRAVFDMRLASVRKQLLARDGVLGLVAELTGESTANAPLRDQYKIVWRYLQNYRVKCPACGLVVPPPRFASHSCAPSIASDRDAAARA
ncbi:MAG TPA: hypothetical protein VFK57_25170 [Vicinamibacterales bacterium]|nr:hypothetical protein [Vicinamibacterales bacterium]